MESLLTLELHRSVDFLARHRAQEPLLVTEDGGRIGADRILPGQHRPPEVLGATTTTDKRSRGKKKKKGGGERKAEKRANINVIKHLREERPAALSPMLGRYDDVQLLKQHAL